MARGDVRVTVKDQAAALAVGCRVCKVMPPVDIPSSESVAPYERAAVSQVAASAVFAPTDAQQVVTDAIIELC